jgi:hypothetical protein
MCFRTFLDPASDHVVVNREWNRVEAGYNLARKDVQVLAMITTAHALSGSHVRDRTMVDPEYGLERKLISARIQTDCTRTAQCFVEGKRR